MGMSSEERNVRPLCGAKKKSGEPCRAFAGQGTDHKGVGRCKDHLGNSPSHKQAAVTAEAQAQMVTLGAPLDVTPMQALQGVLKATAGHVAHLADRVGQLPDLGETHESRAILRLYGDERDRLARYSKAALDAGFTEAEIKLGEKQTELMGKLLEAIMNELDLTQDQRKQVGPAIRTVMPLMLRQGNGVPSSELDPALAP